jgi:hypothetical protein
MFNLIRGDCFKGIILTGNKLSIKYILSKLTETNIICIIEIIKNKPEQRLLLINSLIRVRRDDTIEECNINEK